MLTNREKEDALIRKLRKYNYFVDGDIKLTKEDAALVIRLLEKEHRKADKAHAHYIANREHYREKSRNRYAENKDTINERRRRRRLEGAFK